MIGFVMLSGIIVNNGIVLVDYINQLRRSGVEKRQAIEEAGVTRLRPILMTALTTVLGLIPMVAGSTDGNCYDWWSGIWYAAYAVCCTMYL